MAAAKTLIWAFLCLAVFHVVVEGQESTTVSASDAEGAGEPGYSRCGDRFRGYCLNGGICEVSESDPDMPMCLCPSGWWGLRCHHELIELNGGDSRVTTPAVTTTTTQAEPCDSNPCQHGGECFDNDAGYFCNCPSDWQGDNCEKRKPCFVNPCLNDGICEENGDDFTCSCPKGWKGERCEVEVVDPCQPDPCKEGICYPDRDNPETFTCKCHTGWTGQTCNEDINECRKSPYPCGSRKNKCFNKQGSFYCVCAAGFEAKGLTCVDINECNTNHDCHHDCKNTEGGYRCECLPGYKLDRNKKTCTDIDECVGWPSYRGPCEYDCENTQGSYKCSCKEGYKLDTDRHGCVDINECGSNNGGCDQYCQNEQGRHRCYCGRGYNLRHGKRCIEITCEWSDVSNPENGKYEITNGNRYESRVTYICNHGYQNLGTSELICGDEGRWRPRGGGHVIPPRCEDINECDLANGGCEHTCTNKVGGSECSCLSGYQLEDDGYHCTDIDECADDSTNECDYACVNVESSFYCTCQEGYQIDLMDGKTCRPINCTGLYHPTHGRVTAVGSDTACTTRDVVRGTRCQYTCTDGYDPVDPTDRQVVEGDIVRECMTTGSWTDKRIECSARECPVLTLPDHAQVYPLSCRSQVRFGKQCTVTCGTNYRLRGEAVTTCTNVGSPGNVIVDWSTKNWTCVEELIELNGGDSRLTTPAVTTTTTQAEPCDSNPCQHGGECFDNDAGYFCNCLEGWQGDNCEKRKPCFVNPCLNDGICEENGEDFTCSCPKDWKGERCEVGPAEPCDSNPCQHGGECFDNDAGYFCNCPADWQGDNCEKSKPCFVNPCMNDGICEENGDDFTCSCPKGWKGERCEDDINECRKSPYPCGSRQNRCFNQQGSFVCVCAVGFIAKGLTCVDLNECMWGNRNHLCQHICKNTQGSYRCECLPGYKLDSNKKTCTDIDECDGWPSYRGPCEYDCENTQGSYICSCKEGYKLDTDHHGCVDIDECADDSTNECEHDCVNVESSFYCTCQAGYQIDLMDGKTCRPPPRVLPPRVLSHEWLRQIGVDAGQKVTRDCHAKGHPLPSVAWVKDGSEDILDVEEVEGEDEHDDHKILRLTIDEMRAEDEGLYRCVATNVAGSHDRKVTISIAEEEADEDEE
ncbi:uncharacterized protein LOC144924834 isoform X6 [Branchiostoma floridae x Branchiostoma belcheri]